MLIPGDAREAARRGIDGFIKIARAQTETHNFDGAADTLSDVVLKRINIDINLIQSTIRESISLAFCHASSRGTSSAKIIIETARKLLIQKKNKMTEQEFKRLQRIIKQAESSMGSSSKQANYLDKNRIEPLLTTPISVGDIPDAVAAILSVGDVDAVITQEYLNEDDGCIWNVKFNNISEISRKLILAGELDLAWKAACKLADHFSFMSHVLHEHDDYLMLLGLVRIEEWLPAAAEILDDMSQLEIENFLALINHARDAMMPSKNGQEPSKRWIDQGQVLISKFDVYVLSEILPKLINEASRSYKDDFTDDRTCRYRKAKLEFIIGGSWLVSLSPSAAGVKAVASAFKPVGATMNPLGNATRGVLQSIGSSDSALSLDAIRQIRKLKAHYSRGNEGHQFRLSYEAIGKTKNLSIKELDALTETNADFGNYEDTVVTCGVYSGKIVIEKSGEVSLCWIGPNGKRLKSEPMEVKKSFKRELKELKEKVKDIRTAMSWKSRRLENEMRSEVLRAYGAWRDELARNSMTRSIIERLIWRVEGGRSHFTAMLHGDHLVDIEGNNLGEIQDEWKITLWHPLDSNVDEVIQWRKRIESLKIVQPFKQAHREVYILTDAERKAENLSSRFSGHILKGPQFLELCKSRSWNCVRYESRATVEFDDTNVSASLQLDWELDLNEGCPSYLTPNYVVTGQVIFNKNGIQCLLEEISPKIFSEIMRDVDLFVGVSSVVNDPNWRDLGSRKENDYWESYAFGELSASAETRRDLLERLLPSLASIKNRWFLEDRFLVVRGNLRTYRIHLGSSNIQMEPNNQYLCIVLGQNGELKTDREAIFLPFAGDLTLSLILSKAILLVNDKDIKDTSIMSQILGKD
jgi:hypothetical protein